MNETLEALELFKSWFVDFDPVRAKMDGRHPPRPPPPPPPPPQTPPPQPPPGLPPPPPPPSSPTPSSTVRWGFNRLDGKFVAGVTSPHWNTARVFAATKTHVARTASTERTVPSAGTQSHFVISRE
jgi:hypothetical protein